MNRSKTPDTMSLDKISISAYYHEDTGRCTSMDIKINHDAIQATDVVDAIRAVFQPLPVPATVTVTHRDPSQAETEIIPIFERRQDSDGRRLDPGETTTRLTISVPQ